jgi:[1-hydroxy-2-(trimethylamino)ethyl]phosphonate dioxygenase
MAANDEILKIYSCRATGRYGLSAVNQLQHALQAAALAERAGEPPAIIAAALLHDIGHMIHDLGDDPARAGIDDLHEERGAAWLSRHFGPDVVEPVRLHVPAKRYLCAIDPSYFSKLAEDSMRSLELQGGPMSDLEVAAFSLLPHAEAAVRLRRLDEAAKDPMAKTPALGHFMIYVEEMLSAHHFIERRGG